MTARDGSADRPAYLDPAQPRAQRVDDLLARMTLDEKISQMVNASKPIDRLGVPAYDWWNECLHGVGRAGIATVFPQAIGLAATWDVPLMDRVATAISDEARAKHHEALRRGDRSIYHGLTFWSPNINIFRDPRWGRGHETYGEDPHLAARLGVAFVKGLQGDDPQYLKLVATPKHYAVHSGPEADRHHFDARVSRRDLLETYLPAFEACVREGGAASVMGAYNRTNGEPCCASPTLLQRVLREAWGFEGYVVSDCGAIDDIWRHHRAVATPEEAAALAVREGCDLECGQTYYALFRAVERGLIDEATIDTALRRLLTARMRLGMFDPPDRVPYAQIPIEVNDSPAHRALAAEAAVKSIVLLKNEGGLLPLSADGKRIAVVGPNADAVDVLLGNYNGTPSHAVTPLEGVRRRVGDAGQVVYARGCDAREGGREGFAEAIEAAGRADVVLFVGGLTPKMEGEEGEGGEREDIVLPRVQEDLLGALHETGTPVVLVLLGGSALAVNWADEHLPAILMTWYGGEEAGTALADVLFGDASPAGRLPVTFYRSIDQVPPFEDYAMEGRTYRYFRGEPLYPFGYGLGYTRFEYRDLRVPGRLPAGEALRVEVTVRNAGDRAGDEVVQVYLADLEASVPVPIHRLAAFARIHLAPGESRALALDIEPWALSLIDDAGRRVVEPGAFEVSVGGGQPGVRGDRQAGDVLVARCEATGAPRVLAEAPC